MRRMARLCRWRWLCRWLLLGAGGLRELRGLAGFQCLMMVSEIIANMLVGVVIIPFFAIFVPGDTCCPLMLMPRTWCEPSLSAWMTDSCLVTLGIGGYSFFLFFSFSGVGLNLGPRELKLKYRGCRM